MQRRSSSSRRRASQQKSYFTTCKYCGVKIHVRHMEHDQWVAFDAPDQVHQCGHSSYYDTVETHHRTMRPRSTDQMFPVQTEPSRSGQSGKLATSLSSEAVRSETHHRSDLTQVILTPKRWHQLFPLLFSLVLAGVLMIVAGLLSLAVRFWWVIAIIAFIHFVVLKGAPVTSGR